MDAIRSNRWSLILILIMIGSFSAGSVYSQVDRFKLPEGRALEVWRITADETVRDWANYHNTQCWSQDGRYLCFTHFASDGKQFGTSEAAEIHYYDLLKKKDVKLDNGTSPRWGHDHNWLFYVRHRPQDGPATGKGSQVFWMDLDNNKKTLLAYGVVRLNEPDCDDRWVTGIQYFENDRKEAVRIPIRANSRVENLKGLGPFITGTKWNVNPEHPVMSYWDARYRNNYYATEGTRDIPFSARHRVFCDLDGGNRSTPFPIMEGDHFGYSGDGQYLMCGNGQVRGVRWNEELPANINYLAGIYVGDICRCGFSGRWICGSTHGGRDPLNLADTRSGDGWMVLKAHSVICYPGSEDNSGPYDIDAKGSPDGTKIAFITNYDIKSGPYTEIAEEVAGDRFVVKSTEGFPEKGRLVAVTGFAREVLSYQRKTENTFEDLKRGLYGTPVSRPVPGQSITSFETRLIDQKKWKNLPLPASSIANIIPDADSPLRKQRMSDLYVAVVRLPDQPVIREIDGDIELIPGENHWETRGYHLYRDGLKITSSPVRPGVPFSVKVPGEYRAAAVEWSGLESLKSHSLQITAGNVLRIRSDIPSDFSWTTDRWLVDGQEVPQEVAANSAKAVKEIMHLYDGVIHKVWFNWGQIIKRHDLNLEGKPTRKLFYVNGELARREYHTASGQPYSTELFNENGLITEAVQYVRDGSGRESSHWWYDHARPVKNIRNEVIYEKDGSRWVKK